MNQHQLLDAINGAQIHLAWLDDGRYRQALALLAKTPVDLEELAETGGGGNDTGRRSVGSHSDPTGNAVVSAADRQAQLTDRAEIICDTARWIRITVAQAELPAAPGTLGAALADLTWCTTIPHLITAHQPTNAEERRELHHAADLVYHQAGALQSDVERALRYSATVAAGRPVQRALRTCACCSRWGYKDLVAANSDLCPDCKAFRSEYKCWPTETIKRNWDRGVRRLTPGQIAEARAAKAQRKTGSRRKSA